MPDVMQRDTSFGKNTWCSMSPLFLKTNNNNKKFPLVPEDPAVFRYKTALKKSGSHV